MKSIGNRVTAAFLAAIISCAFVVSQDQIILEASNVVYAADAYSLSAPSRPVAKRSTDSVYLTWNSVSSADAYIVYIKKATDEEFVKYKTVKSAACQIKNLMQGTEYKVKVTPIKINSKNVITDKGKSAIWSVTTTVYDDKVSDLKVTSAISNSNAEMAGGGEMYYNYKSTVTVSWNALASADSYYVCHDNGFGPSPVKDIKYFKSGNRICATITGMPAGTKRRLVVYPVKKINGKEYKGKGSAITFTTAAPTLSSILKFDGGSYSYLGDGTYLTSGKYSAFSEMFTIAYIVGILGCSFGSSEDIDDNCTKYYIKYNDVNIGAIYYYTNPNNDYYLKFTIRDITYQ